jgi:branched-chain amino acid transport system substrate-binding protein
MRTRTRWMRLIALLLGLSLLAAACGSGRDSGSKSTTTQGSGSGGTTSKTAIDASKCSNTTQGVSDTEIKIGMSHPESGIAAPYGKIAEGVKAYFGYVNADKGGVKDHKLVLDAKDDAYDAGRTVSVVNELLQKDQVFGFFNNVGTPNNLAVWDQLQSQCVPNLLAATGDQGLTDPAGHSFTLIGNPGYATESAIFVQYLKENIPDAKIAVLYQNDDYGQAYLSPMKKAIEGTKITIAKAESYEPTDPNLDSQLTTLGASGADVLFLGVQGLKCPQGMDAAGGKGFKFVYLSGVCTASILMGLAKPENSNGVYSTNYIKDPTDPAYADDTAMKLFKTEAPKYNDKADTNDGLVAYGWTQAALLVEILDKSPKLDRVSVMETARNLQLDAPPGLMETGVPWSTGPDDGFPIETVFLGKYDSAKKLFVQQGDAINFEGKTRSVL